MFDLGLKRRDKEARLDEVKAASAATKAALGAVSYGLGANTIHLRFICLFFVVVVFQLKYMELELYECYLQTCNQGYKYCAF